MAYLGRNFTTTNIIVLFAIFLVVYSVYFNTQKYFFSSASFPDFSNLPNGNIQDMNRRSITKMEGSLARARAAIYKATRMKRQRHYVAEQIVTSIGITNIRKYAYTSLQEYSLHQFQNVVMDYISVFRSKYPYWNRSNGADHFFVGCHDWAPFVLTSNPELFKNQIRVLCNANTSEGFKPARDVSMPEINVPFSGLGPPLVEQPPHRRSILAFFAGEPHGYVREKLLQCWKDKDRDIEVHEYLPGNVSYFGLMGRAKFCLCASGYEVASPRIVESISTGCVPVIISDGYVLPFSDVLDWTQFSVHIPIARIPEIKSILQEISTDEYLQKQKNVMRVQKHFILHRPSQPFDILCYSDSGTSVG